MPVASGYEDDDSGYIQDETDGNAVGLESGGLSISSGGDNQKVPNFLYLYGYIYRFGEKAGSVQLGGSRIQCTVFGALCQVQILEWSHAEVDDEVGGAGLGESSGRESLYMVSANGKESKGHIEYLVNVSHGGDQWKIWKRFREFEHLNRCLLREGIKLSVPLPSKTFSSALGRSISQTYLENRKIGLESFLSSALDAVISSNSASAMEQAALFLDDDHSKLLIFHG